MHICALIRIWIDVDNHCTEHVHVCVLISNSSSSTHQCSVLVTVWDLEKWKYIGFCPLLALFAMQIKLGGICQNW